MAWYGNAVFTVIQSYICDTVIVVWDLGYLPTPWTCGSDFVLTPGLGPDWGGAACEPVPTPLSDCLGSC